MIRLAAVAEIGALIGDPGRAAMLEALMDDRALTATARLPGTRSQLTARPLSR